MVNKKRLIEQIAELVNDKRSKVSAICADESTVKECASLSS
jgi:DNA gyrase/topoisomerase IV subunit A